MPTCEPCAKHWTPSSMRPDGTCPQCGEVLVAPALARHAAALAPPGAANVGGDQRGVASDAAPADEDAPKAPWHFKLLLGALVLYLGLRGVQGIEWVARHL